MQYFRKRVRLPAILSLIAFLSLFVLNPVHAALVETQDILQFSQLQQDRQELLQLLANEDVREQLEAMGVSPQQARQRVMAMTHEEVLTLQSQIDELPAGSGVIGAIVFVFLVLLVTDLLGLTDVFPFVNKPPRRR